MSFFVIQLELRGDFFFQICALYIYTPLSLWNRSTLPVRQTNRYIYGKTNLIVVFCIGVGLIMRITHYLCTSIVLIQNGVKEFVKLVLKLA
ncbi:hypothetical protein EDB82DRAFT_513598 [Fusarium venenatum]|uniref:uncharacterized protein n=1 Tax=Fusarium venenatum TaxID=56646 RepID=UPI001DBBCD07|nr:hypothetical protein EDB82DRAFT_513598 [Fusarium venenatum]